MAAGPPERTRLNKLLLGLHFVCAVVVPGAATFAATVVADEKGWGAGLTGLTRGALFFFVLPVYFVYMGIAAGKIFPRDTLRSLLAYVPVGLVASSVAASGDFQSASVVLMRFGLPLFGGFMTLLVVGFVVIAVAKARGESDWLKRLGCITLLTLAALPPVLFVVAMDVGLSPPEERARAALRLGLGLASVAAFHFKPVRELYRAGKL